MAVNTYAYPDPIYQPAMRLIANITNAYPAQVATTFAHDYITGTVVRLNVPLPYGMVQANQLIGAITVTGDTTFLIDIDTTYFYQFVIPSPEPHHLNVYPTVVPVGEINSTLLAATVNTLPH